MCREYFWGRLPFDKLTDGTLSEHRPWISGRTFYFLLEMSPSPPPVRRKNFSQSSRGRKSKSSASESFTRCQHNKTLFFITEALRAGGVTRYLEKWSTSKIVNLLKTWTRAFWSLCLGWPFGRWPFLLAPHFFLPFKFESKDRAYQVPMLYTFCIHKLWA